MRANDGPEQKCATRDISAGGLFFYCPAQLEAGSEIEVVMTLPPEITVGKQHRVCCKARVVRVETDVSGGVQHGIAASIERLEFLPEIVP